MNDWPDGGQKLNLDDFGSWRIVDDGHLPKTHASTIPRLIFHYDFLRPRKHHTYRGFEETALYLLDHAKEITFVTFWADPERLRDRMKARRMQLFRRFLAGEFRPREFVRQMFHNMTSTIYFRKASRIVPVYDDWLVQSNVYPAKSRWLVDTSSGLPELSSITRWPELHGQRVQSHLRDRP